MNRNVNQSELLKVFHPQKLRAPKTAGQGAAAPLAPPLNVALLTDQQTDCYNTVESTVYQCANQSACSVIGERASDEAQLMKISETNAGNMANVHLHH